MYTLSRISLFSLLFLLVFSCKKDPASPSDIVADDGSCQIIRNEGNWHVISQKLEPAAGNAISVNANRLVYANSSLYLQTNNVAVTLDSYTSDSRFSTEGNSLSIHGKDDLPLLDPRFCFEGDTSHRIGLNNQVNVYKDGQVVFTFPSSLFYSFTVSNRPFIGYFYNSNLYTLNLETNELFNYGGYYAQGHPSDFTEMHFHGTFVFDKEYMDQNVGKARLAYSCYNNISYNGRAPHYISMYLAGDKGAVAFTDSTSLFMELGSSTNKLSTSDKQNFYFLYGDLIKVPYAGQENGNLVLFVVDKSSGKIRKALEIPELESASDICAVANKNYVAITSGQYIYKINLSDYSLTDISPKAYIDDHYSGTYVGPYKLASDGNKLFIAMGIGSISDQQMNVKSSVNIAFYE
jgi:hypothetical protein